MILHVAERVIVEVADCVAAEIGRSARRRSSAAQNALEAQRLTVLDIRAVIVVKCAKRRKGDQLDGVEGKGVEKVSALESPVVLVRLQQLVSVEEAALVAAHATVRLTVNIGNATILHSETKKSPEGFSRRAFRGLTNAPVHLAIAIDDLVLCHLLSRRRRLGLVDPRRFFPVLFGHETVRARTGRDRRGVPFEFVCTRFRVSVAILERKGRG